MLSAGPLLSQGGDEQRLKAAFVFRFPQFVTWPPASTNGRNALEICVAGSATAGALRDLTSGESLNGRRLLVREDPSVQSLSSCHVLMVAEEHPHRALLARAATLPVLTVGDSETFLDDGGIIQLKLVDRRVRFEISMPAASRAGITLSSQLLRLAADVRGGR